MLRLFRTHGNKLREASREQFPIEREIQQIIEDNLEEIFELSFVTSEFELRGLRIDTLAYDRESNSFVIIEYKKDRNFSVVDQGIAYLNLMLNNKSDFILEYNERLPSPSMSNPLKRGEIDWSQSRIIFVAPEFTRYQQFAIGFRDFPIELWQIHKYEEDLILLEEITPTERKESISAVAKDKYMTAKVTQEIKIYTEDEHLNMVDKNIKDLYLELKSVILAIGNDIQLRYKKHYVSFRRKHNFMAIRFRKSKLRLGFNIDIDHLNDPLKKARNVQGLVSMAKSEIAIGERKDIQYVLPIIRQAYESS